MRDNEMPKVSVIIPTYNREEVVSRAIDSALNQTLSDIEIIVVDDASTDGTISVLESYGNQIRYFCHNHNQGGSAARNTGISQAKGNYIAFLDSDDMWKPTKLESQINLLRQRSNDWVAAYCGFEQKRSNSLVEFVDKKFPRKTGIEGGEELINDILARRFAHGGSSTLLVRRDVIQSMNGFDEQFQRHQDVEFLIRLLQQGKLAYADEILVYKYNTEGPQLGDVENSRELFLSKFEPIIENAKDSGENIEEVQNFRLAKHHYASGNYKQATNYLTQSSCPHPRDYLGLIFSITIGIKSIK